MKILILYTKNPDEVFNRKSAIGSYIYCLGHILKSEKLDIFLNGVSIEVNKNIETSGAVSKPGGGILKKIAPNFIKRLVKDKRHLASLDTFKMKLLNSSENYDAILEFYNFGSDVGLELSKKLKVPLYITYDGPIVEEYEFFNSAKPFFLREIQKKEEDSLIHASKIVVYSNPMKTYVQNIVKVDKNILLHQNVDFSRFDVLKNVKINSDECVNICFIGSFLKWHQVDLLVRVFAKISELNSNTRLFLVGDGMERSEIQLQVNELPKKIKERIEFTGFLDGEKLFEFKKQMDIGVMPGSNWYGAPNKIFEYGAMKMAVIAPNTPTIIDLFTEEEVSFFEWKNEASFEEKLLQMITDSKLLERYAKKLNTRVTEKYTTENTKIFYTELLNQ